MTEEQGVLQKKQQKKNSFILDPLKKTMDIDILVNEDSKVWFAYKQAMPDVVEWIEYDIDSGSLTFVMRGGRMADYGELILPEVRTYLKNATVAYLVQINKKKIIDTGTVKLITRRTTH